MNEDLKDFLRDLEEALADKGYKVAGIGPATEDTAERIIKLKDWNKTLFM
jgi:hypothetical protein